MTMITVDQLSPHITTRSPGDASAFGSALVASFPTAALNHTVLAGQRVCAIVSEPVEFSFAHPAITSRRYALVRTPPVPGQQGPKIVAGSVTGSRLIPTAAGLFQVSVTIDGGFVRIVDVVALPFAATLAVGLPDNDGVGRRRRLRAIVNDTTNEAIVAAIEGVPFEGTATLTALLGRPRGSTFNAQNYGS